MMDRYEWNLDSARAHLKVVCDTYVEAGNIDKGFKDEHCLESAIKQTRIHKLESCIALLDKCLMLYYYSSTIYSRGVQTILKGPMWLQALTPTMQEVPC